MEQGMNSTQQNTDYSKTKPEEKNLVYVLPEEKRLQTRLEALGVKNGMINGHKIVSVEITMPD